MNSETLLWVMAFILTTDFFFERLIQFFNFRNHHKPIPEELEGIYDAEEYSRSNTYHQELYKLENLSVCLSFVITVTALLFGWFGRLDFLISSELDHPYLISLTFFGILFLMSDLLNLPFSWYRTFVIEERFGFNRTNQTTFWLDKLKGYLLGLPIGGGLLVLFLFLTDTIGNQFWWIFWASMITFTFVLNSLYTTVFLPLFNKLSPLEEGDLKRSIQSYSQKVNFPLKNVFVMDGSKRSSKANAFFSGIGKGKKVVFYDTLIEKLSTEETTAVFAHEVGHFKKNHILQGTLIGALSMGITLFVLSLMLFNPEISQALGGGFEPSIHLNLLAFGILYTPISKINDLISNILSRKNEYEADRFASDTFSGEVLIQGLKKLGKDSLDNLTPHPLFVFVHYSHPTLLQRIRKLQ